MKHYGLCFSVVAAAAMIFTAPAIAQTKAEKKLIKELKEDVNYLSSDALEGRRTGTAGEKKAADYIVRHYEENNIPAYGGKYRHPFSFVYGKEIKSIAGIKVNGDVMKLKEEAFPLPFSASGKAFGEVLPDIREQGTVWLLPMFEDEAQSQDAHFDWERNAFDRANEAAKQGATAVAFYDEYGAKYPPAFNGRSYFETLDIPVVYITKEAYDKHIQNYKKDIAINLDIVIKNVERQGTNVLAYVNRNAKKTVVLGAHYDHLGYGEDGNSLFTKDGEIHNGADDNASGTAALMQLATMINGNKKLNKYNYLFISFSGEELGLFGSKAVVKDLNLDSNLIAYMINMDMVGRLNDSNHALTIGGVGTSPVWGEILANANPYFMVKVDSSGMGPSDHSSFYQQGIPVLFFFTGLHTDYHKPSDDADKINYEGQAKIVNYIYDVVGAMEKQPKPVFTPTKQKTMGKTRMKVTLGIMPDYTFNDGGVRVDGVSEDRPAQKAGIQAGDVIVKLGEYEIKGMQTYMEALGEFDKEQTIDVTVMRNEKPVVLSLTFQ